MWIIRASGWLFKKESITMHGNVNLNLRSIFALKNIHCLLCAKRSMLMFMIKGTPCRKSLPFTEPEVYSHAICEVLTVLLITIEVLWDVAWCCWMSSYGSCRRTVNCGSSKCQELPTE